MVFTPPGTMPFNMFTGYDVQGDSLYKRYMDEAVPGLLAGYGQVLIGPGMNTLANPDTFTLTPPTSPDNSTVYTINASFDVSSESVSYTTVSSSSPADLMTGLYNAMLVDPLFYSICSISLNTSTNVITLQGRSAGISLAVTVTSVNTNLITVAHTVTASTNPIIPFGRFVGYQSTYPIDGNGVPALTLINTTSGWTIYGVTKIYGLTEQVGLFQNAQQGYPFGYIMEVVRNIGTYNGIWVDTVESNIAPGTTPLYIATSGANAGMLTATSTGNLVIPSGTVSIAQGTRPALGRNATLIRCAFATP